MKATKIKKVNWKKWGWLGVLLLIPSLILNIFLFQKTQELGQGILVIGVLDGDTLVLDGKVRLRLRHVDAPELKYCGGKEAQKFLEDLVLNKRVVVKEQVLDQHGRPLALVYVNNTLVNQNVLASGWGRWHHDNSSLASEIKEVADQAKSERKGVYDPKCYQMENLEDPECNIKGNIDKNTGTRLYYYPGCAQYEFAIVEKDIGENWFCTEKEARKAGFEKARTCH